MSSLLPVASPAAAPPAAVAPVRAHKFGGSSLADAACLRHVAALLPGEAAAGGPQIVVASAMRGITDTLVALGEAAAGGAAVAAALATLRQRHLAAAASLDPADRSGVGAWLAEELEALPALVAAITAGGHPRLLARLHGCGEVWSSRLLQGALGGEPAGWGWLDAREVLVVEPGGLGARVDWPATRRRFAAWRAAHPCRHLVVTGFIARDAEGHATTLGRNGSDHSGAIFAALAGAASLDIWTDVDGVLSADPRLVPEAVLVPRMSYEEACELAYFGAKVIHPQTLAPAMRAGMPVRIRNTFRPEHPGTVIGPAAPVPAPGPVKGLSLVSGLAILEVSGAGMTGVSGTAERVFAALGAAGVSIVMISQGSSEHAICCIVREADAAAAARAASRAFAAEIAAGQVRVATVASAISVLAAVGDGMAGTPGVAARLFAGLARAQVNVRAIAQGASERNISVAVASAEATRGLRAAHAQFWLSPQTLSIGVIGPGNVGRALLAQIGDAAPRLLRETQVDLRVRAVARRQDMWLAPGAFPAPRLLSPPGGGDGAGTEWGAGEPADLDRFVRHVHAEHLPHALIVDCSASPAVADRYPEWLAAGIHVVTPNKHAGSGSWERYRAIRDAARTSGARFRYEATVGAGLPVMQTLRDLLDTGDALIAIEGMLSGTLAWLFNRYDGQRPFSALVREAHRLRYTEPDPRDDLSGLDVARKLVILAREAGWPLTLEQVAVESLTPPALAGVGADVFLDRLEMLDGPMAERLAEARAGGGHLRYLAQLDRTGRASVGLRVLPDDHPCARTRLTDNVVQFRTRRYADNPLVIQGPGAGPEVTAAGVFGDILRVALR